MSNPKKHHFFAQFHLRAWAEADGKIPTYQRVQDGTIKLLRFAPDDTGFETHLYAMEDVPTDQRQKYEKEFFGKFVDDKASGVYRKIIESDPLELSAEERMIWTRYLMAQLARVPDMVKHIREITKNGIRDLMMERNATYLALRKESGDDELPETALEWFDQKYPGRRGNLALDLLTRAIQSPKISDQLFRMHWWVYDASMSLVPVLASDRPMQISSGVFKADCIVSLPLTPSKIFLAAPKIATRDGFASQDVTATVRECNRVIVAHADRCVYGNSDMVYVNRYMSVGVQPIPPFRRKLD